MVIVNDQSIPNIQRYCMKQSKYFICLVLCLCSVANLSAQGGKIISKEPLVLSSNIERKLDSLDQTVSEDLRSVNLYRIVYLSDGLKVVGFVAEPKAKGKYPCIIANRGGRWNFGLWRPMAIASYLGRMASWGYVVVASQYRGSSDGGEGRDEFGGSDVNDVLNLVPALAQLPSADTSRIGMYGESRGGMMTYLALKRSCRFEAAVVVAGMADAFDAVDKHPELEEVTFKASIPEYSQNKDGTLKTRSAIFWANEMCRNTPLLIMHGSADSRVDPNQSVALLQKLMEVKHPVRFILFEGADHFITQFETEMLSQCRRHFDFYVRDEKKTPK